MRPSFEKSSWLRLLTVAAVLKVAGAGISYLLAGNAAVAQAGGSPTALSPWLLLIVMLVVAAVGGFLLSSGRKDHRAAYLGLYFLLLSTAFSNRPLLAGVEQGSPLVASLALLLSNLAVDAFAPFFFWLFVREFPSGLFSTRAERWMGVAVRLTLGLGLVLFCWQLGLLVFEAYRALAGGLAFHPFQIAPDKPSYAFYGPFALAMVAGFVVLALRARFAGGEERRRVQLFAGGLVLGLAPLFLQIVLDSVPGYSEFQDVGNRRTWVTVVLFAFFLSAPVSTAYAVLVHHVLNAQLIARRALHYALARYSAVGLAAVPLLALVYYLYQNRGMRVEEIFSSGTRVMLLVTASALGFSALRYRRRLLDSIDRRFFREQYDARQILTLLGERIRATHDVASLASLITKEIDLALHLESIVLMVFDARSGMLVDPKNRSRRLDASSLLAQRISNSSDPIVVDLELPSSSLGKLPDRDRHWLVDSGFRLIVPIMARDGSLLGIVGLGEKKSGLPFLTEDRQLLRAIASSAAWVLELEQKRAPSPQGLRRASASARFDDLTPEELPFPPAEQAKECPSCGALYPSFTVLCTACSRRLEVSHVPYVMPGRFRFERRIGTGGMGVVYRGADLALGRPVAVKTMRRVSPEDALRLRREARTAAAVSHSHLASIYGIETWEGTPMLIMELLEGGTLAQRIEKAKLPPREMIELGIAMAEALAQLHNADILHRDIKPSNIGYTRDGQPKLMDFGIARLMLDLNSEPDTAAEPLRFNVAELSSSDSRDGRASSPSTTRQLVGTLAYLSPEAVGGQREDVSFDLWSLAIVLYECLLGRKIFSGGDARQVMNRIKQGRVPDFSQVCQEHETVLGEFFRAALHRNLSYRPASARELKERLVESRGRL